MKKQTKGIIFTIFFGGGLLFWATAATLPGMIPEDSPSELTITGTPMDNFPDVQREQFCGSEDSARSNAFVQEYKIPTLCTQPLAITTDPEGNVWFTEANAGRVAKFIPSTEAFIEYENPKWPAGGRSMMWGIDYSPDGNLWFTDEATDAIWKFSIMNQQYSRIDFPKIVDSLPQRLSVEGSNIIVNDFTGNKLTFLDPTQSDVGISHLSIPSPVENSVTGAFTVDSQRNVWYTNWIPQTGGVLVKLNQNKLEQSTAFQSGNSSAQLFDFVDIYPFPAGMTTPNGIAAADDGSIWISDTSSNFFFKFDSNTESFTKYLTSPPQISSYGNSSGLIISPVSRPYWGAFDNYGHYVFNEQTANRIGVFDPKTESLVEYMIPSNNPNWADCEGMENCGLAQIFDFTIAGDKIWFTEWVENNIGVIDTSKPLFFNVQLDKQKIILKKGEQTQLKFSITPNENIPNVSIVSINTSQFSDLIIDHNAPESFNLDSNSPRSIDVTITASENALPDIHKVLLSAQTDDLVVSQFVTVIIER
jgi:virginiamycin B lyase